MSTKRMLVFNTPGLIPLQSFTTFGLNSKPKKDNPIGFFGTGLKYAVAITLRLGGTMRVFRSHDEYEFYVRDGQFRGKDFSFVRMRKKTALGKWGRSIELPFTLELGKNWEPWMAVRELESNTRDEDGQSSVIGDAPIGMEYLDRFESDPYNTVIVINCPEMETAYQDGTIFLNTSLPPLKFESQQCLEAYDAPSDHIYMNGIRVYTPTKPTRFTYNFTRSLELTEDRTPKHMFMVDHYILNALQDLDDEKDVASLLALDENKTHETTLDFDVKEASPSSAFSRGLSYAVNHGGGTFARATTYERNLNTVDYTAGINVLLSLENWVDIQNVAGLKNWHKLHIQKAIKNHVGHLNVEGLEE